MTEADSPPGPETDLDLAEPAADIPPVMLDAASSAIEHAMATAGQGSLPVGRLVRAAFGSGQLPSGDFQDFINAVNQDPRMVYCGDGRYIVDGEAAGDADGAASENGTKALTPEELEAEIKRIHSDPDFRTTRANHRRLANPSRPRNNKKKKRLQGAHHGKKIDVFSSETGEA